MIRICGNWGNTMADIIIKQSSFYNDAACRDAVGVIESKYTYTDETEYFGRLVNFSTAKTEPYQRWVRYREGYSTSLVNDLIQRAGISRDKHFIADPMVGSGSTMISACRNGFDSFGVDVNPFCQLIITTKLLAPEEKDLCEIEVFLKSLPEKYQTKPFSNPPLSEYFPPQNLVDLLQLREEIDALPDDTVKQILTACWFFILESCSNRKKDGNGLATRPAPVTNVISRFRSVMNEMISDYREYPFTNDTKSKIYTGSACNFSEYSGGFEAATGKKLGAIIFSPPYATHLIILNLIKWSFCLDNCILPMRIRCIKRNRSETIVLVMDKNYTANIRQLSCCVTQFMKLFRKRRQPPESAMHVPV